MEPIENIRPYDKNAKTHPKEQVERIARSIAEFGFNQPIVVNHDGVIIVGHGRFEAAKLLGHTVVPVLRLSLNDEQSKAYRLADNKLNESAWDMDLVIGELKGLSDPMIVLSGFDKDLIIEADEKDEIIPPMPAIPRTKLGDYYDLGPHRIVCGDSTEPKTIDTATKGMECDLSFTSPPYNVGHNLGYDSDSKYANSDDDLADYTALIKATTLISISKCADVFVNLQLLANNKRDILVWLGGISDYFKDVFFWRKTQVAPAMAENVANSAVELVLLFGENNTRRWGTKKFRGNFSNYLETKSAASENKNTAIHHATFPVELPVKFITHGYPEQSTVLDPFIGSGTTLIACEKTKRICFGIDIDPLYVDVAVQRWVDYTGCTEVMKNGIIDTSWQKTQ